MPVRRSTARFVCLESVSHALPRSLSPPARSRAIPSDPQFDHSILHAGARLTRLAASLRHSPGFLLFCFYFQLSSLPSFPFSSLTLQHRLAGRQDHPSLSIQPLTLTYYSVPYGSANLPSSTSSENHLFDLSDTRRLPKSIGFPF